MTWDPKEASQGPSLSDIMAEALGGTVSPADRTNGTPKTASAPTTEIPGGNLGLADELEKTASEMEAYLGG